MAPADRPTRDTRYLWFGLVLGLAGLIIGESLLGDASLWFPGMLIGWIIGLLVFRPDGLGPRAALLAATLAVAGAVIDLLVPGPPRVPMWVLGLAVGAMLGLLLDMRAHRQPSDTT
ncbi:hypothetical protein [Cellulosimicrobium sp. Marseille-Q8652]